MRQNGIYWLHPQSDSAAFPSIELALTEPNGLLAAGGDLSCERLLAAYRQGIFPWYSCDQPILWWSPDPRAVLFPDALKISRSLHKTLNRRRFDVTLDTAFAAVITACAEPRHAGAGTWITAPLRQSYIELHQQGHAHSVESWYNGRLVGGLYGLALGNVFFGESMFSRATDASKVAFVHLVWQLKRWGFILIDCQVASAHLASLGATTITRRDFKAILEVACNAPRAPGPWQLTPGMACSRAMHDSMDGGGRALHGANAEEQLPIDASV